MYIFVQALNDTGRIDLIKGFSFAYQFPMILHQQFSIAELQGLAMSKVLEETSLITNSTDNNDFRK